MKLNIRSGNGDKLQRLFETLSTDAIDRVDKVSETYARKMANESAELAPVRDHMLKNSILASPKAVASEPGVWSYGSNVEYARRQEYEHKTRRGFIRRAVWDNPMSYRGAIGKAVLKR